MRKSPQIPLAHLSGVAVMCVLASTHFSYAEDRAKDGPIKTVEQPGQFVKSPDDRIAMAFSGNEASSTTFVMGEDGVVVKAGDAAPAAVVGARDQKVQRPDIINTYAAIEPAEQSQAHKEIGLQVAEDPRMAEVERYTSAHLKKMIFDTASKEGVDPKFAVSIAKIESLFDQFALSEDGAMGVMQLMPKTAAELGVENPWDAAQNIQGGVRYLKELTAEFQHPLLVAAAYHSGPQAVHDAQGIPKGPRTAGYVVALLNGFYDIYGSSGAVAKAPVSKKKRPSHIQTAALSGASERSSEETPAANGVGKWEQGFVLHLD